MYSFLQLFISASSADSLERLATSIGMRDRVAFLGQLPPGPSIREQLDRAHVFVLPSRTEGMPRALIEAMARGLPCIGSTVGGIPELIEAEDLVPPSDATALAARIREVVNDPERMHRMSVRNREKALQYHEENLRKLRVNFYQYVREKTENRRQAHHLSKA